MFANIIPLVRMPYGATSFTYKIPSDLEGSIFIGQFVEIPFRKKAVFGIIVSTSKKPPLNFPLEKIAFITSIKETQPSWNTSHLEVLEKFSSLYHCSVPTLTKSFTPEIPKTKRAFNQKTRNKLLLPQLIPETKVENQNNETQTIVYHNLSEKVHSLRSLVKAKKTLILCSQITDAEELFQLLECDDSTSFLWDNQMNKTNQWQLWQEIKEKASLVIASRSGLFLPLQQIEQIIIDHPESNDHKSWEATPNYDIRDMAKLFCESLKIPLIQFSLSPRIANSTQWNLTSSSPAPIHSIVHKSASLPLHENLIEEMKKTYAEQKHLILINNAKYEASTIRCLDCKQQWICPNQHGSLHVKNNALFCSSCAHQEPMPNHCTSCKGQRIKAFGLGLEGLSDWIKNSYEQVQVITAQTIDEVTIDSPSFILTTPYLLKRLFRKVEPNSVGKIIYLHPENLLFLPDYRSNEWFFQAIQWHRAISQDYFNLPLTIQTTLKNDDGSFDLAIRGDLLAFRQEELKARKLLQYPPFSRIITITLKSPDLRYIGSVEAFTRELNKNCPYTILGPFSRYRKNKIYAYSWQIKQTTKNDPTLDKMLNSLYSKAIIDINPEQVV